MAAAPEGAPEGSSGQGQIRSVQALRAIAALFVVVFHATILWRDRFDPSVQPWQNGNAGVDLFFVISGFIMVVSSRRLTRVARGWRRFLELRLVRIAPLYWLTTASKLAVILAVPTLALHTRPTAWNSVASFLFIPARDGVGMVRPVLDVGWTLSFEMLFYAVFACALAARLAPVAVVAPAMLGLAACSVARQADWPAWATLADPIVLEFLFGAVIGTNLGSRLLRRLPLGMAVACLGSGLLCLGIVPAVGPWARPLIWGVAASVVLAASLRAEAAFGSRVPKIAVRIGEASYSLYLTHGFVLPVLGLLFAQTALMGAVLGGALVVGCVLASTVAALLAYRFIEMPMTNWLRGRLDDRRATPPQAARSP